MTAKLIDGTFHAQEIMGEVANDVKNLKENKGVTPCLGVIMVGDDPASAVYVRKKQEACERVGINSILTVVNENDCWKAKERVEWAIYEFNGNANVHGILLQLPVPGIRAQPLFEIINPKKDVDVLHPENVGLLVQHQPRFKPCTPHGVQVLLNRSGIEIPGKHVVVINRSNVVGKPLSSMLVQDCDEYANATVTVCHDRTPPDRLKELTLQADIVCVAVGKPGFLTADMVKPGAVVVDIGITRVGKRVVGDVDFERVKEVAGWITKVPGGIGPMTVAMLMFNTVQAAASNNFWR